MHKKTIVIVLILALNFLPQTASAQTSTPASGPIYVVQEGDTLWGIAVRFGVSVDELVSANNLATQDIYPGNEIMIPGLEGLNGTLITVPVPFGSDLRSMSRQYQMDQDLIKKINHIISPAEIYAGYEMIVLQQNEPLNWSMRTTMGLGETWLEVSARQNINPWVIATVNDISLPVESLPGDIFYANSGENSGQLSNLPEIFTDMNIDPLPLVQGDTMEIKVKTSSVVELSGNLGDYTLHFFPYDEGYQVALQGIHGMLEPGLYPLRINAALENQSVQSFEQMVLAKQGDFITEPINGVEPDTIDPNVTGPEDQWLQSITGEITFEKSWQGKFGLPVDSQSCLRSKYGNRRSYNGGVFHSFHTGVDFGVCSETHPFDIYAPANGVVVYTGLTTVRGNVTIIDHGQGVYSGLYHQEEIFVSVGETVLAGELIGKMGKTGRATGVHLHWDLFVNGVQVDPLAWLNENFPH